MRTSLIPAQDVVNNAGLEVGNYFQKKTTLGHKLGTLILKLVHLTRVKFTEHVVSHSFFCKISSREHGIGAFCMEFLQAPKIWGSLSDLYLMLQIKFVCT